MAIEWISSETIRDLKAFITVDKQRRFSVSMGARRALKLPEKAGFYLFVAYDKDEHRLVVGKPGEVSLDKGIEPFKFDPRGYASARPYIRKQKLDRHDLPQRFYLIGDGKDASKIPYLAYPKGTYAFRLDVE
ncbi:hypothetical protein [Bacillus glycinifermentans]|uniref:hypothetical protein n=1 Tax=Bacillus glycinifermentans TaxID=1664069 RepID=UPI001FF2658A|nr:hypothetical protein [Bacillus glycinifermentans]UOY86825.1 hypothetical protein MW696_11935 [Bacillus glycinifermentans]